MSATLALVGYTLSLSMLGPVVSSLLTSRTVSNTGTVKAIGIGVYWDYECTNPVPSIVWGTLEPGSSKNVTCYIKNEGNAPSTLSMYTTNWDPSNAGEYMTLSWDYRGQTIDSDEARTVIFTLSVSASIEGITDFRFDISIEGTPTTSTTANLLVTESTPDGPVSYLIDGNSGYQTNKTYSLDTGIHVVELPSPYTSPVSGVTYDFSQWEDGSTENPRTITLSADQALLLHGLYVSEIPPPTGWAMLQVTSTNPTGPSIPFKVDGSKYHPNGTEYLDGQHLYYITSGIPHEIDFPTSWTSPENSITYSFSVWSDGITDNPRTIILEEGATLHLHAILLEQIEPPPMNGLRGNLHTHTTWSDGSSSPLEMVTHYRDLGYDFVAITDHDVWTDVSGLQDLGIIVFEGIEHSSGEHWNEIWGGGETLTIKNHPDRYGDAAEEIINGPWDCHEATNHGTVLPYYTTIDHPYVYTDDAHSTWDAGKAWIVVDVTLTGNLDQDKALILQAIKAGNYDCQTG